MTDHSSDECLNCFVDIWGVPNIPVEFEMAIFFYFLNFYSFRCRVILGNSSQKCT
jgi:hypothetical protein